jgi:hypothetical protein
MVHRHNTAFIHDLLRRPETREAARSGSDRKCLITPAEAKHPDHPVNVGTRLFDKPATLFDTLRKENVAEYRVGCLVNRYALKHAYC